MADQADPTRARRLVRPAELAWPAGAGAVALAQDLQDVARALSRRDAAADRALMQEQSLRVSALAGPLGAIRLQLLAEELQDRADDPACTEFARPLAALRDLLHALILAVQADGNRDQMRI